MKRMTLGWSALVLVVAGTAFAAQEQSQDHMASAPSETRAETRAEAQDRAGRLFDRLDLNHDGKLDQADRAMRTNAMFDRLDTNHDGSLSRDEFAAAHEHGGPDHGGPDHPMDHEHSGGHMGHWGYDHRELDGLVMMIIQRADPGHAGTVTRAAFVSGALALFDQADTNHDGILTPEEHRAAAQAMRQQMHSDMARHGWMPGAGGGDMPPPPPAASPPVPPPSPN